MKLTGCAVCKPLTRQALKSGGARVALAPILVSLAFFALYAMTPVAVHRFDAVGYMAETQGPAPHFPPYHLLYVWLAQRVRDLVGPSRVVTAMQILSMACAAAALGLYCTLLHDVLRPARVWWAVLGTCLLGLSSSFWISAVESDPYAITLVCLIGASACYLRAVDRNTLVWHVVAGSMVALATVVHQLVALYTFAYIFGLAFGRVRRPLAGVVAFLSPAAGIPAAIYLAVGVRRGVVHDIGSLLHWLTEGARAGDWGAFRHDSLVQALYGFLYAVAGGAGGLLSPITVRTVAVAILIVAGYVLVRRARAEILSGPECAVGAFLAAWIVLYVSFIVWWAPYHTVHWQFVLVPLIVILVRTAARISQGSRVAAAVLALIVALVGGLNYVRVVWPLTLPDNDHAGAFLERALATLPPDARVVATIGPATFGVSARLGAGSVFVVPYKPSLRSTTPEILGSLRAFVEGAWAEGRSVLVFASLLEPARGSLSDPAFKAEVRRLLERLRAEGRLLVLPTDLLEQPMRRHPWDVIGS